MRFADMNDQGKLFVFSRIDAQTTKVRAEVMSSVDSAINYLFLSNAGGAVAVLSFVATTAERNSLKNPLFALGLFSLGLILVGVVKAYRVHYFTRRSIAWSSNADRYFAGDLDWEGLNNAYSQAATESRWPYCVAYGSFACLALGGVIGFCLLWGAA
jgi:hypothetical protein